MGKSFDAAAVMLYLIFGATIFSLIYFLFDIKNVFGKSRMQKYVVGHPEYKDLESLEGVIEVKDNRVAFKESADGKAYFSVLLKEINNVSTGYGAIGASNNMVRSVSRLVDERHYLFIEVHQRGQRHTLKFSAHRSSSVNDKVKKEILQAKRGGAVS